MRRRSLVVVLLACLLPACGSSPPTYSTAFPEQREDLQINRLPVDVIDLTGLVDGVLAVEPDGRQDEGVSVVGDELRVQWLGGACESRVRLTLRPAEDGGYLLHIDSDSQLVLGCPGLGVQRNVRIHLTRSIEGEPIAVTREY